MQKFTPSELSSDTSRTRRSRANLGLRLPFSTELSQTRPTLSWQPSSEANENINKPNSTKVDDSPYDEWIENNLKIQSEEGQVIPLRFTSGQKKINAAWDKSKEENGYVRLLIGKCRRIRASTVTQARIFEKGLRQGLVGQSLTLGDDENSTDVQYWMTRRFRDHLKTQPRETYSRRGKEIIFDDPTAPGYQHPINFRFAFQIAHEYAGTAQTIHALHLTELAKWSDPTTTMGSLMPAARGADVIAESTGNGQVGKGQYFFDMCQLAMRGDNEWTFVFIPWFEHEEYYVDHGPRFDRLMDHPLNDEERALMDAYKLSDKQIAWRRSTILTDYSGDIDMFRQEFPSSHEEMFLRVEGRRVFDMEACRLSRIEATKHKPEAVGSLRWTIPPVFDSERFCINQESLAVDFVPDPNGFVTAWEMPPDDDDLYTARRYMLAGDVAQGVEGGDDSHAALLDRRTSRSTAVWHGQIDPSLFGEEMAKMVVWTTRGNNETVACPEVNSMGDSTLTSLHRIVGAAHVWRQTDHAPGAPYSERLGRRFGFFTGNDTTNSGSKERAVQCLVDKIRESMWFDPDEDFWSEALSVTRRPNGVAMLNGRDRTSARCILAFIDTYGQAAALEYMKLPGIRPTDAFTRGKEKMRKANKKKRNKLGLASRKGAVRGR